MKRRVFSVILVLALMIGGVSFAGCNPNNESEGLTIYTSMYPMYDFTRKVVGNHANIINLVGPGEEAHHYELTSAQRAGLESAGLIVINGLDMEHWAEELPASILSKVLVASDGIELLQTETQTGTLRDDPHAWLSLRNGKVMMENIKNKMIELDSANAADYERNYARYAALFDGLDAQFTAAVSEFSSTTIVVSHKAFGYLSRDYGLTQIAISGLDTDDEANPQTVAEIITYINENNVRAVFYQESISSSIAAAIASQTSAVYDLLYTVESLSAQQIAAGEDFLSLMAHNLVVLSSALN